VYEGLARFCDAQTSKAVLGQVLTSEAGSSGSYALGKVHGAVRRDLMEADCTALAKTISRQVLRPLVGFNFGWDVPSPVFRFLHEPGEDLKQVAETYRLLAEMGLDISQEHLAERFRIPLRGGRETALG
ncbi:MAG: DUF935 family protein, partial [Syntrophobacteraceae bacterium]